jgi:hypothetical protein
MDETEIIDNGVIANGIIHHENKPFFVKSEQMVSVHKVESEDEAITYLESELENDSCYMDVALGDLDLEKFAMGYGKLFLKINDEFHSHSITMMNGTMEDVYESEGIKDHMRESMIEEYGDIHSYENGHSEGHGPMNRKQRRRLGLTASTTPKNESTAIVRNKNKDKRSRRKRKGA